MQHFLEEYNSDCSDILDVGAVVETDNEPGADEEPEPGADEEPSTKKQRLVLDVDAKAELDNIRDFVEPHISTEKPLSKQRELEELVETVDKIGAHVPKQGKKSKKWDEVSHSMALKGIKKKARTWQDNFESYVKEWKEPNEDEVGTTHADKHNDLMKSVKIEIEEHKILQDKLKRATNTKNKDIAVKAAKGGILRLASAMKIASGDAISAAGCQAALSPDGKVHFRRGLSEPFINADALEKAAALQIKNKSKDKDKPPKGGNALAAALLSLAGADEGRRLELDTIKEQHSHLMEVEQQRFLAQQQKNEHEYKMKALELEILKEKARSATAQGSNDEEEES